MFIYDDGGRAEAGFRGDAGDCVVRAVAIASGRSYADVYADLNQLTKPERQAGKRSGARSGIPKRIYEPYIAALGFTWTPTMKIGSGCKVHLRADELPGGIIIARLSKHLCAVIDGVIHDTHDPSREGTRCVYGYWSKDAPAMREP